MVDTLLTVHRGGAPAKQQSAGRFGATASDRSQRGGPIRAGGSCSARKPTVICARNRHSARLLPDNLGSGAAAQHGPSGLRAVAGAASATSAAASSSPRKRAPRRRRGRPRPGRGMSPLRSQAPAMPDGTKAIEGYPRPHARACVWRPSVRPWRCASLRLVARRWPVLRNRGGRPAVRGSRTPRAMIARGRAGAPRRVRAIAQARRASGQARP